jgi:hypothetical protein
MHPTEADVSFLRACGISWPELEEIIETEKLTKPSKLLSPGLYKLASKSKSE